MEKNEERKDMTRRTEEEMNWEEYLKKIHAEAEAEIEQEEREEKERQALVERALDVTEIRRKFLQYNRPEEWLAMTKSGEAAEYLQKVQEKTQETYLRIIEEREEKELWGQDQSGLKGLQICRRIARETQAEMIENLSI